MSVAPNDTELHRFLFEDLAVRGAIVRLTEPWQELLLRRASNAQSQPYAAPVAALLGELAAASVLMQAMLQFNGSVVLQIMGDGPVKLLVAEARMQKAVGAASAEATPVQFRCTAKVVGDVAADAGLSDMVNVHNKGQCAITLDAADRKPSQAPYQGVVPLFDDEGQKLNAIADVLAHYMLQSEQLDTHLVLAANETAAAGILVQRMPRSGVGNLGETEAEREGRIGTDEDFKHIATITASLKREELLTLEPLELLHRLYWNEKLLRHEPTQPRFVCSCSRERVSQMLRSLGQAEVDSVIAERGEVEVGCEFCGQQQRFDAVDAAGLFQAGAAFSVGTGQLQ